MWWHERPRRHIVFNDCQPTNHDEDHDRVILTGCSAHIPWQSALPKRPPLWRGSPIYASIDFKFEESGDYIEMMCHTSANVKHPLTVFGDHDRLTLLSLFDGNAYAINSWMSGCVSFPEFSETSGRYPFTNFMSPSFKLRYLFKVEGRM
jgi:hypothetical protein